LNGSTARLAAGGKRSRSRRSDRGFFPCADHVTIEELTRSVRESAPRIGAVTVYRTLKLLERLGYAKELDFGGGARRYESNLSRTRSSRLPPLRYGHRVRGQGIENLQDLVTGARVSTDGAPTRDLRVLQEMRTREIRGTVSMNAVKDSTRRWAPHPGGKSQRRKSVVFGALTGGT